MPATVIAERIGWTWGMTVLRDRVGELRPWGLVERANGYVETSFLPGRSFEDIDDFNRQLAAWLKRANQRIHGTTKVRPAEAIFEDRGFVGNLFRPGFRSHRLGHLGQPAGLVGVEALHGAQVIGEQLGGDDRHHRADPLRHRLGQRHAEGGGLERRRNV